MSQNQETKATKAQVIRYKAKATRGRVVAEFESAIAAVRFAEEADQGRSVSDDWHQVKVIEAKS